MVNKWLDAKKKISLRVLMLMCCMDSVCFLFNMIALAGTKWATFEGWIETGLWTGCFNPPLFNKVCHPQFHYPYGKVYKLTAPTAWMDFNQIACIVSCVLFFINLFLIAFGHKWPFLLYPACLSSVFAATAILVSMINFSSHLFLNLMNESVDYILIAIASIMGYVIFLIIALNYKWELLNLLFPKDVPILSRKYRRSTESGEASHASSYAATNASSFGAKNAASRSASSLASSSASSSY